VKVIDAVALAVSNAMNVSKAEATLRITINVLPQTNSGTDTCAVRLQIFPPTSGDLTANDFLMAIWEQFNAGGDAMAAEGLSLSGVAGYNTFGSLEVIGDGLLYSSSTGSVYTSGAISSAVSYASSFTIGIIATIGLINKA